MFRMIEFEFRGEKVVQLLFPRLLAQNHWHFYSKMPQRVLIDFELIEKIGIVSRSEGMK